MLSLCTKFGGFGGISLLELKECDPAFDAINLLFACRAVTEINDLFTCRPMCAELSVTESGITDRRCSSISSRSSRPTPA